MSPSVDQERDLWRSIANSSSAPLCLLQTWLTSSSHNIRAATDGALPPTFIDAEVMPPLMEWKLMMLIQLIRVTPDKYLNPISTWLLKECIDLLAPCVAHLFNTSLATGCVPESFKVAYITPLLKKTDAFENFRLDPS